MALPIERKVSSKKEVFSMNVDFDGIITTALQGNITSDIVKFLLYQRQQLPMPYNELQRYKDDKDKDTHQAPRKKKGVLDLEKRRRDKAISSLEALFEQLDTTFSIAHYLQEVVILLGGTTISPKETYVIKLPTAMYEGKLFTLQQAKSCLFRQLVTNPCWVDVPEMKATNMHIFLYAARDEDLSTQGLKPRLTFKKPTKGRIFNINLGCKCAVASHELSKLGDTDFEISGIEPFDESAAEFLDGGVNNHVSYVPGSGTAQNDTDVTDDFIWYQIPIIVQGIKTKTKS